MTDPPTGAAGVQLDLDNPWLDTVDLNTFERLPDHERMRVIIRVLCELVALDSEGADPSVAEADVAGRHGRVHRLRRLPFLGVEVDGARKLTKLRHSGGLPHLQHERSA